MRIQKQNINRFANGVVSAVTALSQPTASVPHAINFLFDEELDAAVLRKGLTEIGSGTQSNPILGMHNHRGTNNFALVAVSNGSNTIIYKSTGGAWSSSLTGDTDDLETDFVQFLDTTVRVNRTDAVKATTDATTWATTGTNLDVGNFPNGSIVKVYKQRMMVVNNSTVYQSSIPLAHLDYDAQSANFTIGATLTGATSGATATILHDTDSGTTGTLKLGSVKGIFQNDEIITDEDGGSATANGTSTFKISWTTGNYENLLVDPDNGSGIIGVGITGGVEGICIFLKNNGGYRYNGSFLDPKPFTSVGCTSKKSIVNMLGGIGYANQEGFYFTNGNQVTPLTQPIQDWWDAIAPAYLTQISAYCDNRRLLISIGDITKKDIHGKSKTYTNVVLYKNLQTDSWSILSFAKEFKQFIKYYDSNKEEIWGGTDAGEVHELFEGTSDDGAEIFFELISPIIIGDDIASNKTISELITVFGRALKGAKVYITTNGNQTESIGACEEDVTELPIDRFDGKFFYLKISNNIIGAPVIFRGFGIPHIDTDGVDVPLDIRFRQQ